jgi:recombination protein RecA
MFSMSRRAEKQLRVVAAAELERAQTLAPAFALDELRGRLVQMGGQGAPAALTMAFALVLDAQRQGEPAAWLMGTDSAFYAPDVAAGGVDLDALSVVRVTEPAAIPRAAAELARSGAFGLLVLDVTVPGAVVPQPLQSRLLGLAQKHEAAIVFLTDGPSLGSLISLRAEATLEHDADAFICRVNATKDKRRAPGWSSEEVCRGPAGLR